MISASTKLTKEQLEVLSETELIALLVQLDGVMQGAKLVVNTVCEQVEIISKELKSRNMEGME